MSVGIRINIDTKDIKKKIKHLEGIKNGGAKAVMRALNRTVNGMKTDAAKEVSSRYTAKQKDVKDKLQTGKASMSNLSVALRSKGRPMASAKFRHTANKNPGKKKGKPVSLVAMKGQRLMKLHGDGKKSTAFMASMKSGHRGIFQRIVNLGDKDREKIREVYSPGVVQMMDNKETREAIQNNAVNRFNKELDHQIKHLLDKRKG